MHNPSADPEEYSSVDFFREAYNRAHAQRVQRIGQCLFNWLAKVRPELAEAVRGTDLDPFYDNGRIAVFSQFVTENWNGWKGMDADDAIGMFGATKYV